MGAEGGCGVRCFQDGGDLMEVRRGARMPLAERRRKAEGGVTNVRVILKLDTIVCSVVYWLCEVV